MSRGHGRRGSLQIWPRKRARRITPNVNWSGLEQRHRILLKKLGKKPGEAGILGFAAFKAGMTHVMLADQHAESRTANKTVARAVTILEAPPLYVLGFRVYQDTYEGLKAVGEMWFDSIPKDLQLSRKTFASKNKSQVQEKLSADNQEKSDVRLIVATQPQKSGMRKLKPDVLEMGILGEDAQKKIEYAKSLLGKEISVKDVFRPGEYIDVSGVSRGFGFTGTIPRYGIRIQGRKDKKRERHPGSIGSTTPRKVDWRVPMAGQYGFFERTEFNKRILMVDSDPAKINQKGGILGYGLVKSDFVLVEGSLPGHDKRTIFIRKPMRAYRKEHAVTITGISTESKQNAR